MDDTVDLLVPPVRAVGIGGAAAGVVLVGAWAGQRVRRRDDELRSLIARGISPGRIAVRGTLEAVLPLLVGAAAGAAAAWFLVRELGPSARLPRETTDLALVDLGIGIAVSLVVVSAVTAVLASRLDRVDAGRATQRLGRIPWLPVVAAITVVTALPLVTDDGGPRRLDMLTLGVPLLVTAVAAGAVTALLPRIGRRTDARLRRLPPAGSLALRRALTARGASRLVVVSTALALGLALYAGALGDSTDRTIAAKAAVASPSDVVVPLVRRAVEDGPLPAGSSLVGTELGITLEPGDLKADLLVLDPDTFPAVAHWDDSLSGRPLDELIDAITEYDGDRLPVVVAGSLSEDVAPVGREFTLSFGRYYSLVVEVVGRADAFPGQQSQLPMLVADLDSVSAGLIAAGRDPARVLERQVWATGEAAPVLDALVTAGYAYEESEIVAADRFAARPDVRCPGVVAGIPARGQPGRRAARAHRHRHARARPAAPAHRRRAPARADGHDAALGRRGDRPGDRPAHRRRGGGRGARRVPGLRARPGPARPGADPAPRPAVRRALELAGRRPGRRGRRDRRSAPCSSGARPAAPSPARCSGRRRDPTGRFRTWRTFGGSSVRRLQISGLTGTFADDVHATAAAIGPAPPPRRPDPAARAGARTGRAGRRPRRRAGVRARSWSPAPSRAPGSRSRTGSRRGRWAPH